MALEKAQHNRQPQARTTRLPRAGSFLSRKRLQQELPLVLRDARALVINGQGYVRLIRSKSEMRGFAVPEGVLHDVRDDPS
jgi:hypothetical protein